MTSMVAPDRLASGDTRRGFEAFVPTSSNANKLMGHTRRFTYNRGKFSVSPRLRWRIDLQPSSGRATHFPIRMNPGRDIS